MALEDLTGTKYIDDLVSTNPAAGDNVSEGDDHIRGIKNVLKTTFPSIDGAITATDTELNYVDGVTSSIQAQLDSPVAKGDGSSADGYIQLNCSQNSHGIKLQSPPHSANATYTLVFPNDDGNANEVLLTNGSGVLDWTTVGTASLAADAVTNAKIADDSIDSEHYVDGSIDTAHIGDNQVTAAKVAADVATQAELDTVSTTASAALPKAGGAMTGNTTHADNVKALYGTGNDLEIYHDGSHSYVTATGTGDLVVRGDDVKIQGATGGEIMVQAVEDGDVKLYHNNLERIATTADGVSVTGAVYATGGTFGLDAGDKIAFANNSHVDFNVNNATEMRLEADGDLHVDGDVIAYSTTISDEALKYDINPVEFALDKINQLKGVSYKYKHNDRESAGLLAQDVEKVMPSAVNTKKLPLATGDDKEYKTLHYDSMTAILVEAIKELTAKVKKLENR